MNRRNAGKDLGLVAVTTPAPTSESCEPPAYNQTQKLWLAVHAHFSYELALVLGFNRFLKGCKGPPALQGNPLQQLVFR